MTNLGGVMTLSPTHQRILQVERAQTQKSTAPRDLFGTASENRGNPPSLPPSFEVISVETKDDASPEIIAVEAEDDAEIFTLFARSHVRKTTPLEESSGFSISENAPKRKTLASSRSIFEVEDDAEIFTLFGSMRGLGRSQRSASASSLASSSTTETRKRERESRTDRPHTARRQRRGARGSQSTTKIPFVALSKSKVEGGRRISYGLLQSNGIDYPTKKMTGGNFRDLVIFVPIAEMEIYGAYCTPFLTVKPETTEALMEFTGTIQQACDLINGLEVTSFTPSGLLRKMDKNVPADGAPFRFTKKLREGGSVPLSVPRQDVILKFCNQNVRKKGGKEQELATEKRAYQRYRANRFPVAEVLAWPDEAVGEFSVVRRMRAPLPLLNWTGDRSYDSLCKRDQAILRQIRDILTQSMEACAAGRKALVHDLHPGNLMLPQAYAEDEIRPVVTIVDYDEIPGENDDLLSDVYGYLDKLSAKNFKIFTYLVSGFPQKYKELLTQVRLGSLNRSSLLKM